MSPPVSDLYEMLARMAPVLLESHGWQFVTESASDSEPFAVIHEKEAVTRIVKAADDRDAPVFARITLQVHSDLQAVGLTAAVSNALAGAGLSCNVIAGFHHDHIFVPWDRREEALMILTNLSQDARR